MRHSLPQEPGTKRNRYKVIKRNHLFNTRFEISKLVTMLLFVLLCGLVAAQGLEPRDDGGFCETNGAKWDTDLWNSLNMTDFFFNRCNYYSGVGGGSWPPVSGVPRAFAQYANEDEDDLWNWPTGCMSVSENCDIPDSGITTVSSCQDQYYRGFSLWAMRNVAIFMQSYYTAVSDVYDTTSLSIAEIISTFIYRADPNTGLDASSFLSIMSTVIGAIGSIIPEAKAVSAGVSAILKVGSILADTGTTVVEDPRFTDFADFENRFGDAKVQAQSIIEATFKSLFADTPPAGDAGAGTQLSAILSTGAWANQDMAGLTYTRADMVTAMRAGIISEAWNSGQQFIMAWAGGSLNNAGGGDFALDPCSSPISDLPNNTLCVNGRNYAFLRNKQGDEDYWLTNGFDSDTLGKWNLTREMVIASSENIQNLAAEYVPRNLQVTANLMQSLYDNPPNDITAILQFNLAVCNIDDLQGNINIYPAFCDVNESGCLAAIGIMNCQRLQMGDSKFPYTTDNFYGIHFDL